MNQLKDPIVVTSALPYANGDIHIGHLVEYIQTDIFVRFLKMCGHDVIYICASDTHGTPIEIKAAQLGVAPEEMVARYNREHLEDFEAFQIRFERFYTTHSDETRRHSEAIFQALDRGGLVEKRSVELTYCEHDRRFLPDRYVKGTCPKCGASDQYGDNCQVCGGTYEPTDLKDAQCILCSNAPVRRDSVHYFFLLSQCRDQLAGWVGAPGHLHETTRNWIEGAWLNQELRDWDISRDAPYFGFIIPGETEKYFYVWLDAPVGYIGSTQKYCEEAGLDFDGYWKNPESTIIHFIGKDIAYFHTLFWPAMLLNSEYHAPDRVQVHGFLTVNGEKMSKRTGTAVTARTYLKHLDPQYLRYYYACKLGPTNADLDLNLEEFAYRVNAELINKIANLASRSIALLNRKLDGRVGRIPDAHRPITDKAVERIPKIRQMYLDCEFARAVREIVELADIANKQFQDAVPFKKVESDPEAARGDCTTALNFLKVITGLLKPVLPFFAEKVEQSLNLEPLGWDDLVFDYEDRPVGEFSRLVDRVDPKKVQAMVDETKETSEGAGGHDADPAADLPQLADEIDINDFARIDLRVARVLEAELIPKARSLIRLKLDMGFEQRTVFAGIKGHFDPEALVGKNLILVANLKPKTMRFGESHGMILVAESPDGLKLVEADRSAQPGSKIS
jgi:methionyl-tRNA synthetase